MLYVLLILLGLLVLISFYLFGNDIMAPSFIICVCFFASTVACIINSYYWKTAIDGTTIIVIIGGCLVFILVGIICKWFYTQKYGKKYLDQKCNISCIKIKKWKIILILFLYFILIVSQIRFVNEIAELSASKLVSWGNKMEYYRNVISYDSSNLHIKIPSYISFLNKILTIIAYVFLYINVNNFLASDDEKFIKKISVMNITPVISYIVFNMVAASRGCLIQLFISAIVLFHLLYHKKNGWNKKYDLFFIFKIILLVFLLLFIFVKLRDIVGRNYSETAKNPIYYICCYFGGSIHLLNDFILEPIIKSDIFGKETFYSIIRFLGQRMNISEWVYPPHLEFRYSNGFNVGNVYTAFRKYIYDFGYAGVIWCTSLVSFIYNIIYYRIIYGKKKELIVDYSVLFFAYIAYGYFYMSIQEQVLSTILCTTTLLMPIFYRIIVYLLIKLNFYKNEKLLERQF